MLHPRLVGRRADSRQAPDCAQPGRRPVRISAPLENPAASTVEKRLDLDAALATLPPHARLCVVLAYSEGMSHAEISESTAIPLGTVKSHVARGAARLRELLHDYGGRNDR